jgi:cytidine deaminase
MIIDDNLLVAQAKEATKHAYSPYSGYRVGAALMTKSGKIFTGCNIENASYSLTICAERSAVAQAVSAGETEFLAIAIYVDSEKIFPPCGACRQVLIEFSPKMNVIYTNDVERHKTTLEELLPHSFGL